MWAKFKDRDRKGKVVGNRGFSLPFSAFARAGGALPLYQASYKLEMTNGYRQSQVPSEGKCITEKKCLRLTGGTLDYMEHGCGGFQLIKQCLSTNPIPQSWI